MRSLLRLFACLGSSGLRLLARFFLGRLELFAGLLNGLGSFLQSLRCPGEDFLRRFGGLGRGLCHGSLVTPHLRRLLLFEPFPLRRFPGSPGDLSFLGGRLVEGLSRPGQLIQFLGELLTFGISQCPIDLRGGALDRLFRLAGRLLPIRLRPVHLPSSRLRSLLGLAELGIDPLRELAILRHFAQLFGDAIFLSLGLLGLVFGRFRDQFLLPLDLLHVLLRRFQVPDSVGKLL